MSIEETVWKFLRGKGLSEVSTAAVMGNIYAESGFDQNQIEAGTGIGFGLCQWSYERRTQLEHYGTDLTHQLNFLWTELTGQNTSGTGADYQWIDKSGYKSHTDFMSGNGSVAELTAAMCFCWERPNASVAHLNTRQQKANDYYTQFTGTQPSVGSSNASSSDSLNIISTNYQVVQNSRSYGDVLYGRRYRITVSDSNGNAFDVSQLRCTFSIIKTMMMEPNSSQIVIYNLNAETENSIIMNGARVTVEAGYEGNQFGLIFDGDILQTVRGKEDSATYELTIIALDSDKAINFDLANYSILKGQTARAIIEHIVNNAKNPVSLGSISDELSNSSQLTRGKVLFGKFSDYLRQIAQSNNSHFYIENGQVNIINMNDLPDGEIYDLSPSSGLIGTPEQTDYGVSGQCLLNPGIKLNTLIHIDNSLVRAKIIDINSSNSIPSSTNSTTGSATNNSTRNKIIDEAKKLCDDPNVGYSEAYRNQTINGKTYYDCSSFTKHCYAAAGINLDDITNPQWAQVQSSRGGKVIDLADALPGDLVFWFNGSDCYHVAIYAGSNSIYAASTDNKPFADQVLFESLYGQYKIGRIKALIDADNGQAPSSAGNDSNTTVSSATTFRSLDKDGIYRIYKLTYSGDTRGNDWYCNFEAIDQAGGIIPAVAN